MSLKIILLKPLPHRHGVYEYSHGYVLLLSSHKKVWHHYGDVIMRVIASQITSLVIVYSTVYSDADERKHRSSVSLAFVRGIHRGLVNSPHKWPVTRKKFPFDDVIMIAIYNPVIQSISQELCTPSILRCMLGAGRRDMETTFPFVLWEQIGTSLPNFPYLHIIRSGDGLV